MATKPPFAPNAQVEHPKFGPGTVVICDDQYVVINFDEHGDKKFIASIAVPHLTKLEREPPAKKTRARKPRAKKAAGTKKAATKKSATKKAAKAAAEVEK